MERDARLELGGDRILCKVGRAFQRVCWYGLSRKLEKMKNSSRLVYGLEGWLGLLGNTVKKRIWMTRV